MKAGGHPLSHRLIFSLAEYGQCCVGHGGALVEAITLNRRVVGSTPALAAM